MEIENLIIRPQIVFGVPMAIQAPCHAMGLSDVNHRHVIDRAMATETADAPVHMRRVIVINVIDRAIQPDPLHGIARLRTVPHGLQLGVVFLHLRMAVHARLRVRHI